MRSLLSKALAVLTLLSPILAEDSQHKLVTVDDVLSETKGKLTDGGATNSEAISDTSTTFNGIQVPPMKELTGEGLEHDIKDGYWSDPPFAEEKPFVRLSPWMGKANRCM